jgi:hypothetical protein
MPAAALPPTSALAWDNGETIGWEATETSDGPREAVATTERLYKHRPPSLSDSAARPSRESGARRETAG